MTTKNGPGPSRHTVLFSAIEQAAAPTVKLDEPSSKNEEANQMLKGSELKDSFLSNPQPHSRGSALTSIVGK